VFATQNPIEYEGTYPLPEAQLDRFLFKTRVTYPSKEDETAILGSYVAGFDPNALEAFGVRAVFTRDEIAALRRDVATVTAAPEMLAYIVDIVRRTREWPTIAVGASPRAAVTLLVASRALAAMRGRAFITPDETKGLARAALRHRIILRPDAEIEGVTADDVVDEVLKSVPVPR
jgi:MoxR-like ATPase